MRRLTNHEEPPTGAAVKGAQYRETLQTTGCYVDRILIVPREFAPMPQPLLYNCGRLDSNGHQNAFSEAWRNLSVRCRAVCKPKPGLEHRLPPMAPDPGSRTRREERGLLIVSMSSGRLFLDRVGRHQSPSPLRRHAQTTTHLPRVTLKPELPTLLGSGSFYFALTYESNREAGYRDPLAVLRGSPG